jgi:hypothetical protein
VYVWSGKEVPAEDDRVGPDVAHDVGREVRRQRRAEALRRERDDRRRRLGAAAQSPRGALAQGRPPAGVDAGVHRRGRQRTDERPREVVLDDLLAALAQHAPDLAPQLRLGLLAVLDRLEVEVVRGDAPLEEGGQHQVVERLQQVDGVPLLVRVDAHDLVAEIAVLAADVRVGVVDVVVRVLPRLGGRSRVPVPGRGGDLGVVHPVPLAVHDVVADLHVLEDLGHGEQGGAGEPGRPVARAEQQHAPEHHEPAVHLDHAHDVAPVAVAELGEDLVVDGVELAAELLDLLVAEPRERALDHAGHPAPSVVGVTGRSRWGLRGR